MVSISEVFDSSPLTGFRKLRMQSQSTIDDILKQVEECWENGQPPNLRSLLLLLPKETPAKEYAEVAIIDLQNRWKSGQQPLGTAEYLTLIPQQLPPAVAAMILCQEFDSRNRFGDCPTRAELCSQYRDLQADFLRIVERETRDTAEWPWIIVQAADSEVKVPLDRPIRAGRQSDAGQRPWSLIAGDFEHQLVLCEMSNNKLSRQQLALQLVKPDTVRVRNCSRNRAIGIRGKLPLDAGQEADFRLDRQINIHLFDSHYLQILKHSVSHSR
jgi:hypothetical protein